MLVCLCMCVCMCALCYRACSALLAVADAPVAVGGGRNGGGDLAESLERQGQTPAHPCTTHPPPTHATPSGNSQPLSPNSDAPSWVLSRTSVRVDGASEFAERRLGIFVLWVCAMSGWWEEGWLLQMGRRVLGCALARSARPAPPLQQSRLPGAPVDLKLQLNRDWGRTRAHRIHTHTGNPFGPTRRRACMRSARVAHPASSPGHAGQEPTQHLQSPRGERNIVCRSHLPIVATQFGSDLGVCLLGSSLCHHGHNSLRLRAQRALGVGHLVLDLPLQCSFSGEM